MKTPVSRIWISSLVLASWLPVGIAQIEPNLLNPQSADSARDVVPSPPPVFPEITSPKDSPSLPSSEGGALVLKRQPPKIRLSPWTGEIVKLAESGIEESVILSFIENAGTFNLGADQIVYLNDLGLSSEIITTMLRHDQEIVSGARPLTIASDPAWEALAELTFKPLPKMNKQPVPTVTPASALESARVTSQETLVEIVPTSPTAQFAAIPYEPADKLESVPTATFNRHPQSAERKNGLYRVREPHPEEVTPPFFLIHGESRPPNTVVVVGFPRPAP